VRVLPVFVFGVLLLAALIFVPAGRLDWTAGWVCLLTMVIGFSSVTAHVFRRTPSLIRRRARVGSGTPLWDRVLLAFVQILFMAILIIGGLDARFGWTSLPLWLQVVGVVLMLVGALLLGWAMGENRHFESSVRIQDDQHHRVIESGPYRVVRHPGYGAGILLMVGVAFVLGSAWAVVPAILVTVVFVVRTLKEDRFLHANLEGYRDYARRTRFRLVPGIW
jgi:protein-S-isoprenylcysteine O-methyltransferase Ste14